jgi:hypothetical protein
VGFAGKPAAPVGAAVVAVPDEEVPGEAAATVGVVAPVDAALLELWVVPVWGCEV